MHYNACLAVLFLRIVLYGPQNLVSFKKFPCTDGLGSTETVSDQPYCNTLLPYVGLRGGGGGGRGRVSPSPGGAHRSF